MGAAGKLFGGKWEVAVRTEGGEQRTKRQRSDVRDQMSEGKRQRTIRRLRRLHGLGKRDRGQKTGKGRRQRSEDRRQRSEVGELKEK